MRSKILAILLPVAVMLCISAAVHKTVTPEEILYVVLDNDANNPTNKMMKHAVDLVWTNTKFQYITEAEYAKSYVNKQGCYFLRFMEWEVLGIDRITAFTSQICMYDFVIDQTGDYVKKGELYEHNYTRPYGFRFTYKETNNITKKLKTDIKNDIRQSDVTFVVQWFHNKLQNPAPYTSEHHSLGITTASGANKKANAVIHKKTLVISQFEADFYGMTEDKMKSQYGFPCKIVPDDELEKYIDTKDAGIVYIRSRVLRGTDKGEPISFGSGESTYVFVVDAATGFIFYADDNIQKSFVKAYIFRTLGK